MATKTLVNKATQNEETKKLKEIQRLTIEKNIDNLLEFRDGCNVVLKKLKKTFGDETIQKSEAAQVFVKMARLIETYKFI